MDYEWQCSPREEQYEIDYSFFDELLATNKIDVIDVRETDEIPSIDEFAYHHIPLGELIQKFLR